MFNETEVIMMIEWATKDLDVTKFRNGDEIIRAQTQKQWVELGRKRVPALWEGNGDIFYYNQYAVLDERGLAPEGWRIPTAEELQTLIVDNKFSNQINLNKNGCIMDWSGSIKYVGSDAFYWSSSTSGTRGKCLNYIEGAEPVDSDIVRTSQAEGQTVRCVKL